MLGLSIVKSIVTLHAGTVSLASEAGAGTRVTLRFPNVPGGRSTGTAPPALAAAG